MLNRSTWEIKYAELYHFGVSLQVVMQCLGSVVAVKRQHGMFGVPLEKLQEFLQNKPVCFSRPSSQ